MAYFYVCIGNLVPEQYKGHNNVIKEREAMKSHHMRLHRKVAVLLLKNKGKRWEKG